MNSIHYQLLHFAQHKQFMACHYPLATIFPELISLGYDIFYTLLLSWQVLNRFTTERQNSRVVSNILHMCKMLYRIIHGRPK